MKYRPEIDGLRAVAVISVIIYHARFNINQITLFTGGFLGVDIFFVISGYLMTLINLPKIINNNFTITGFYEQRARRILPALYFVIFLITPLAWFYMTNIAFSEYLSSIISSIFFISNIFFYLQDSYSSLSSSFKPLLHTWSLSVEEQFYVIFPLILFILIKIPKRYNYAILVVIGLGSLVYSDIISSINADAAFYLIFSRLWELFAGVIIAILEISYGRKRFGNPNLNAIILYLSSILLCISIIKFNNDIQHPSVATTIPVLSVVGILWFIDKSNYIYLILTSRLFVFIGLISYSLYLWHQPIFSIQMIRTMTTLTSTDKIICILVAFLFSIITYLFIEKPYRNKLIIPLKRMQVSILSCSIIFMLIGYFGPNQKIIWMQKNRLSNNVDITKPWKKQLKNETPCFNISVDKACILKNGNKSNWYFVGDSHISSLQSSIVSELDDSTVWSHIAWHCFYAPGAYIDNKEQSCGINVNYKRREVLLSSKPGIVVIGGGLNLNIKDSMFSNKKYNFTKSKDNGLTKRLNISKQQDNLSLESIIINATLELINYGHKVVLIYPIPEVGFNVPMAINSLINKKDSFEVKDWLSRGGLSINYDEFKEYTKDVYHIYDSINDHPNLIRVYPEDIFCEKEKNLCYTHDTNDVYYYDGNHLTTRANEKISNQILKRLKIKPPENNI